MAIYGTIGAHAGAIVQQQNSVIVFDVPDKVSASWLVPFCIHFSFSQPIRRVLLLNNKQDEIVYFSYIPNNISNIIRLQILLERNLSKFLFHQIKLFN